MIIALNEGEIEQHFFMFYRLKGATVALGGIEICHEKKGNFLCSLRRRFFVLFQFVNIRRQRNSSGQVEANVSIFVAR